MRYLTVIMIYAALLASATSAQGAPGENCQNTSELAIVGKNKGDKPEDFRFQLGESLSIKATGDCLKKVQDEWSKTTALTLYFDGEPIADLKSPPQQLEIGKELLLEFSLVRDAESDANRQAWDRLFKKKHEYEMTIQPALAIGKELPLVMQSVPPLEFYVATNTRIYATLVAGLALLVVTYWYLVRYTKMLRDAGTNYYSLGKSQMAFWGLLVVLSFSGVWFLTGTMERIPPQALILLGISGATGLSAVVIGTSKKAEVQTNITEAQTKLTQLQHEKRELEEQKQNDPAGFSQASKLRLAAIEPDIASKSKEVADMSKQIRAGESKGFWRDICDDGNGASFHRLQVVIWTMVLGAIFVQTVAQVMSMPEFPQTLLTLMGISNVTYLGFKIPEKQA